MHESCQEPSAGVAPPRGSRVVNDKLQRGAMRDARRASTGIRAIAPRCANVATVTSEADGDVAKVGVARPRPCRASGERGARGIAQRAGGSRVDGRPPVEKTVDRRWIERGYAGGRPVCGCFSTCFGRPPAWMKNRLPSVRYATILGALAAPEYKM